MPSTLGIKSLGSWVKEYCTPISHIFNSLISNRFVNSNWKGFFFICYIYILSVVSSTEENLSFSILVDFSLFIPILRSQIILPFWIPDNPALWICSWRWSLLAFITNNFTFFFCLSTSVSGILLVLWFVIASFFEHIFSHLHVINNFQGNPVLWWIRCST